jgi:hypothetical protein
MKAKERRRQDTLLANRGWPNRNLAMLVEAIVDRAVRKARREERAKWQTCPLCYGAFKSTRAPARREKRR